MALKSMAILCNTCKRIALCCSTCPIGRHTPDARSLDHIVNAATQPVTNAPAQRTTYRHPRLCMQPFFRRKAGDVIHHLLPPSAACSCVQRCGSGPQAVVDAVPPEVLSHARSVLRGGVPVLLGTVAVNGAVGHLHQFREAVLWWLYLCAVAILDLLSAKVLWQHRLRSLPHLGLWQHGLAIVALCQRAGGAVRPDQLGGLYVSTTVIKVTRITHCSDGGGRDLDALRRWQCGGVGKCLNPLRRLLIHLTGPQVPHPVAGRLAPQIRSQVLLLTLILALPRCLRPLEPVAQHSAQKLARKPRRRVVGARDLQCAAGSFAQELEHAGLLGADVLELADLLIQMVSHPLRDAGQGAVHEAVFEFAARGFLQQACEARLAQMCEAALGQVCAAQHVLQACVLHDAACESRVPTGGKATMHISALNATGRTLSRKPVGAWMLSALVLQPLTGSNHRYSLLIRSGLCWV